MYKKHLKYPISKILEQYETDKVGHHGYGETYDELFSKFDRQAELSILEIGIQKGGSLLAWQDYFPNAKITGVDIVDVIKPEYRSEKINYVFSDIKDWQTAETFDIIIDDGSHFADDVRFVIDHFVSKLRPNGVMIVEDIQDAGLWQNYELIRCGPHYDDVLLIIRK